MDGMALTVMCLALNVYFEASGESQEGMAAVAHVTINRAKRSDKELCDIVAEDNQFSWANGNNIVRTKEGWYLSPGLRAKINRKSPQWANAHSIALAALYTDDLTGGATHFHTPDVNPSWNKMTGMQFIRRIGNHLFYKYSPPPSPPKE